MEELRKKIEEIEGYLGMTMTENGLLIVLKDKQINVSKEDIENKSVEEIVSPLTK